MIADPITVNEIMPVIDAAELMKRHQIRRFPVVRNNELVGIGPGRLKTHKRRRK